MAVAGSHSPTGKSVTLAMSAPAVGVASPTRVVKAHSRLAATVSGSISPRQCVVPHVAGDAHKRVASANQRTPRQQAAPQAPVESVGKPSEAHRVDGPEVVQRLYDALNARDLEALGDLVAEDCKYENLALQGAIEGRGAVTAFYAQALEGLPEGARLALLEVACTEQGAQGAAGAVVMATWQLELDGTPLPHTQGVGRYRLDARGRLAGVRDSPASGLARAVMPFTLLGVGAPLMRAVGPLLRQAGRLSETLLPNTNHLRPPHPTSPINAAVGGHSSNSHSSSSTSTTAAATATPSSLSGSGSRSRSRSAHFPQTPPTISLPGFPFPMPELPPLPGLPSLPGLPDLPSLAASMALPGLLPEGLPNIMAAPGRLLEMMVMPLPGIPQAGVAGEVEPGQHHRQAGGVAGSSSSSLQQLGLPELTTMGSLGGGMPLSLPLPLPFPLPFPLPPLWPGLSFAIPHQQQQRQPTHRSVATAATATAPPPAHSSSSSASPSTRRHGSSSKPAQRQQQLASFPPADSIPMRTLVWEGGSSRGSSSGTKARPAEAVPSPAPAVKRRPSAPRMPAPAAAATSPPHANAARAHAASSVAPPTATATAGAPGSSSSGRANIAPAVVAAAAKSGRGATASHSKQSPATAAAGTAASRVIISSSSRSSAIAAEASETNPPPSDPQQGSSSSGSAGHHQQQQPSAATAEILDLSGLWEKDPEASQVAEYEAMMDVLQLSGLQKVTARLIEGLEILHRGDKFEVSFVTVVPFFKVTEPHMIGGSVKMMRRDLRRGPQASRAEVMQHLPGVRVVVEWGEPLAGGLAEEYVLQPDGSSMAVTSTLAIGGQSAMTTQVYRRSSRSRAQLLAASLQRHKSLEEVMRRQREQFRDV